MQCNDVTVSIIIPCYNGWRYFENCLKSLENQTILPDEVIIVDDCSTDDSFIQIKNYADNSKLKINLLKNGKNSGPSVSRMNALLKATSDYVCFCDCDDWYELDFVEKIKRELSCKKRDLIIFDNYKVINDRKERAYVTKHLDSSDKKNILANYPMSLWRFVVSLDIMSDLTFPNLYHGEDSVVATQIIIKSNDICVMDEAFYNYFYRPGSASNASSSKTVDDLLEAFYLKKEIIPSEYADEIEYIGIKDILYGAVLNAFKAKLTTAKVKEIVEKFEADFPNYKHNIYSKELNCFKKIYVWTVRKHFFFITKFLTKIHSIMT